MGDLHGFSRAATICVPPSCATPRNAELRYLLGAELRAAQISEAVAAMHSALDINPCCTSRVSSSACCTSPCRSPITRWPVWAPLEELDETAALKAFKRGLEALIRDDFSTCIGYLQQGIDLNKHNTTLNEDMTQLIARVRDGSVIGPAPIPASADDFARFGEPSRTHH